MTNDSIVRQRCATVHTPSRIGAEFAPGCKWYVVALHDHTTGRSTWWLAPPTSGSQTIDHGQEAKTSPLRAASRQAKLRTFLLAADAGSDGNRRKHQG